VVNQQFHFALHIMTALALGGRILPSRALATSIRTNPVVVRRLLLALARADLVETHSGRHGGARLAKPAHRISLLDIYDAIQPRPAIGMHERRGNRHCPISCNMKYVLGEVSSRTERVLRRELECVSVAKIARDIARAARRSSGVVHSRT